MIYAKNINYTYESYEKSEGLRASFKDFFSRKKIELHALKDINLNIHPGEMIGLLGPNGAGKTTLMKILVGLIYPKSGELHVMGKVPYKKERAFLKNVGLVLGQKSQLIWDLPPVDTYRMLKEIYEINQKDYETRLNKLVSQLGVSTKINTPVRKLSLGERMKCELIASFLHQPKLLLLDEPTIGLDLASQKSIYSFLLEMNKFENTTIIITSHYMNDIKALCDRLVIILDGQVTYDGKTSALTEQYNSDEVSIKLNIDHKTYEKLIFPFKNIQIEYENNILSLNIDREKVTELAQYLLENRIEFTNIKIEEVNLEEIIYKIFSEKDSVV
ncbi:ABC transporter ATP-binding protein [Sporosarcina sp. FSL K6-3457]|uniref:ABC transporter ATP-binding protein n=1 Tax=Sporosarcina sp. FSL K6-3457 TaxID=2978204 RepID=UPI0030F716DA